MFKKTYEEHGSRYVTDQIAHYCRNAGKYINISEFDPFLAQCRNDNIRDTFDCYSLDYYKECEKKGNQMLVDQMHYLS
jgi:hypothetical protein